MNGFVDLHIHSSAASGSLSPESIVVSACEKGLRAVSVTDRYIVDGCRQAAYIAKHLPLIVVPGVEIDSFYGDADIRILGYGIDTENDMLLQVLDGLRDMSFEACCNICKDLNKLGFNISMASLFKRYSCHMITRSHIAHYMSEKGFAASVRQAFEKYIGPGAPAFVPEYKMSPEQSCTLIELAGGISVLAAPKSIFSGDVHEFRNALRDLKAAGIKGLEVMHPGHSSHEESFFRSEALHARLIPFGGSDFYGELSPETEIGTGLGSLMVPADVLNCIPGL